MIPSSEQAKTVYALDCAATVIGCKYVEILRITSVLSNITTYNKKAYCTELCENTRKSTWSKIIEKQNSYMYIDRCKNSDKFQKKRSSSIYSLFDKAGMAYYTRLGETSKR
jgi:hypothetical protein